MRRADKEITDRDLISEIINSSQVCRLGLAKDNIPRVCFECEHGVRLVTDESSPCKWTFSFQSVIGYGSVRELTDPAEKVEGLTQIVRHYSAREWAMSGENLEAIRVWKIAIESLSGKQSKDKFVS
jgi:nitroimidazol reductase NimA-like FMN-containing flavoprotein (pyridoxamine 5'-phosphate oxidase superfamily)